ncbi:CoA transferase [Aeromicrobium sp. YIM 150415]|uniref:CaiB/BaiF CoA transferase family protein n=1 Tax=Aeromicrobium sp. YIM 150415 TaxID=2803912 RepID=UPI0019667C76|nr:CoA transferase [Aeromicrobium sp. YIM 150415]MBM9464058.1 CoA transferase [Aeromicrobium sp. YIM 150415]
MSGGALAGQRVVDISRVLAGPYCAQMLGDHGADVVKIEPPGGDGTRQWGPTRADGVSAYYAGLNRNKEHLVADLTSPRGRGLLLDQLESADVLVENFKPGTMAAWDLDVDYLLDRFPRLVYCQISAFGQGPMAGLPGYDAVVQAYSGLMYLNGEPDRGPLRLPMPITDLTTGLQAFAGVLLALQERERSGRGQLVSVSLYDAALSLLHPAAATYFMTGVEPRRLGSAHPSIAPCEIFDTADGQIYLAAGNDQQFATLVEFLNAPEMAADPRFRTNADRLQHRHELNARLAELVAHCEASAGLARIMIERGVPASPVRPVAEVLDDPDLVDRGMGVDIGGLRVLGIPVHLGRTPGSIRTAPRPLGADRSAHV